MKRLLLSLAFAACSGNPSTKKTAAPATPVYTANVAIADVPLFFEAIGTVKAKQVVEIKPQVTGVIKSVHFTEGDFVKEGDLLYTIDDASYVIKAKEAEALLLQDKAHLQSAEKKLKRYESLYQENLISKQEWEELETKLALTKAMVKADLARLAGINLDISRCKITAPISGKIGKTTLHAGNKVTEAPLVTLIQSDPLYVEFFVTEAECKQITSSSSLKIYELGKEKCIAEGKLVFLDHSLDPKTGMLFAKGVLSPSKDNLLVGQSVRVQLIFGVKEKAKLIPMQAVKTNEDGAYVFSVKEDSTVEIKPIVLGPEENGMIVVEEGLNPDEKVVTQGHLRLYPGSQVEEVSP